MIGWLLILAFSSAYTPRSASSVSLMNQKSRLEQLLTQHNLFDGENITKQTISTSSLTGQDYTDINQIGMIWSYISQSHGTDELAYLYEWTTGFDSIKNNDRRNIYQPFLESLGYTGTFDQRSDPEDKLSDEIFFNIYYNKGNTFWPIDIQNYNSLLYITSDQKNPQTVWSYIISLEGKEKEKITISKEGKENIYINLYDYKDELYQLSLKTNTTPSIWFDGWFIIVDNLNGTIYKKNNTTSIGYYSLMVFVK